MKQGKYAAPVRRRRRRNTLKPMLIAMAVVLLLGCVTGGTLAWLTATTDKVENTFTTSDINITLEESENLDLKMIPGYTIEKDPVVTVVAGSEDCYLFVKIDESSNLRSYVSYTVADGWTELTADKDGNALKGIYYRPVMTTDAVKSFSVLKDDKVEVLGAVTKTMMDELKKEGATQPTLTFRAAAVQYYKNNNATDNTFSPAEAYDKVQWPST